MADSQSHRVACGGLQEEHCPIVRIRRGCPVLVRARQDHVSLFSGTFGKGKGRCNVQEYLIESEPIKS